MFWYFVSYFWLKIYAVKNYGNKIYFKVVDIPF